MLPPWAPDSKYRPLFRGVILAVGAVWVCSTFTGGPKWVTRYVGLGVILSQTLLLGSFNGLGHKLRVKFDPRGSGDRP